MSALSFLYEKNEMKFLHLSYKERFTIFAEHFYEMENYPE